MVSASSVSTIKIYGIKKMIPFPKVTRVEVIDNDGRRYVKYNVKVVNLDLQDDERTLKLFVEYEKEEEIENERP